MSCPYATLLVYTPGFCLSHIVNSRVKQWQASSQNVIWHQDDVRCQPPRLLDGECPTQLLAAHQSLCVPSLVWLWWWGTALQHSQCKPTVCWSLLCPSAWSPPQISICEDVAVSLSHLLVSRLIYPNLSNASRCIWSHPRTRTRAGDWACNKSSSRDSESPVWLWNEGKTNLLY